MQFRPYVRLWPKAALAALAIFILACAACAGLDDHYLAVSRGETENTYYRVHIAGGSYWSSSKFQAGVVDTEAVNRFFGESVKPLDALMTADPAKGAANKNATMLIDPLTGMPQPDRKLVMVLSNDSTVVFAQLKAFSESQEVSALMAAMAQSQGNDEAALARADLGGVKTLAKYWVDGLKTYSSTLQGATKESTKETLLQLQGYLGGSQP